MSETVGLDEAQIRDNDVAVMNVKGVEIAFDCYKVEADERYAFYYNGVCNVKLHPRDLSDLQRRFLDREMDAYGMLREDRND